MTDDLAAIRTTVQTYLDGLYASERNSLSRRANRQEIVSAIHDAHDALLARGRDDESVGDGGAGDDEHDDGGGGDGAGVAPPGGARGNAARPPPRRDGGSPDDGDGGR